MIKPSAEVAEHYFERIFDISDDGMFFVDADAIILRVNLAFTTILDYHPEEIVGKSLTLLTHKKKDSLDDKLISRRPLHRLLISEKEDIEDTFYDRKENPVPLRLHSIVMRDDDDNVTGAIGVFKRIPAIGNSDAPSSILKNKVWEAQQNF